MQRITKRYWGIGLLVIFFIVIILIYFSSVILSRNNYAQEEKHQNTPPLPGAALAISVVDKQGKIADQGVLNIQVEYQDLPDRNYSYTVKVNSFSNNSLGLYPPPRHIPATITLQVETNSGEKSDALVVKNDQFWDAYNINKEFVGKHTFVIGEASQLTSLNYNNQN